MNEVQRAAIARADARIAAGMEGYHLRMKLYRKVNDQPIEVLRRLALVVDRLTPDELDAALGYAEGLAAWSDPEQESVDATLSPEGTETGTPGG